MEFILPSKGAEGDTIRPLGPVMSDQQTTTNRERLRMHLMQALIRTESDDVQRHLKATLREWENLPPTPLQECPICEKVGLPERIQQHACTD